MPEAIAIPGLESRFAEIEGSRIHYYVGGDGPPLVLVHGLGGAAPNWIELAPLVARGHRVLVPDLPGHGLSEALPALEDLRPFAERVAALAELEAMAPIAVVGHSMGGVVALRLALVRPELVSALVLVETAGITSATRKAEIAFALTALVRPARKLARFRSVIAPRTPLRWLAFSYWGAADPAALSPNAVLGFLAASAQATGVVAASKALLKEDPRQELHDVRCPTLLVWGSRDRLVPLEDGFEFARRLRAPIRTIASAGHLVIGERPEECAEVIEGFLDSHG